MLTSSQVIKWARNQAILEGLQSFFWDICQHIIGWGIKRVKLWNMGETGFIHKKNLRSQLYQKSLEMCGQSVMMRIFKWPLSICVSATKYVALSLLILPEKRLNSDFLEGCDIQGAHITTAPKVFINNNLLLKGIEFFANSVPVLVAQPLALVYDGCCCHYNDDIVKNRLSLKLHWFYCQIMPTV